MVDFGLLAQGIDILLIKENVIALRIKKLTAGRDLPVLIMDSFQPVENGLVESLRHPGGNLTGTMVPDCIPKSLELLALAVPEAEKIFLPYNPNEPDSTNLLLKLKEVASLKGFDLVLHKIHAVEEAIAAIENLHEEIDAIYMTPSPVFSPSIAKLSEAALRLRIPLGTSIIEGGPALAIFTTDAFNTGRNTARMARQIFKGIKPSDIPVETSEVTFIINLKTAEEIGIKVPNNILALADKIIRE